MERRHRRNDDLLPLPLELDLRPLPSTLRDAVSVRGEILQRRAAKNQCRLRAHRCEHSVQPAPASLPLLWLRLGRTGRSASNGVRHEVGPRLRAHGRHHRAHLLEEVGGRSNKRLALAVLLLPWRFADHCQSSVRVPSPEHDLGPALVKRTARAALPQRLDLMQRLVHAALLPSHSRPDSVDS